MGTLNPPPYKSLGTLGLGYLWGSWECPHSEWQLDIYCKPHGLGFQANSECPPPFPGTASLPPSSWGSSRPALGLCCVLLSFAQLTVAHILWKQSAQLWSLWTTDLRCPGHMETAPPPPPQRGHKTQRAGVGRICQGNRGGLAAGGEASSQQPAASRGSALGRDPPHRPPTPARLSSCFLPSPGLFLTN